MLARTDKVIDKPARIKLISPSTES